MTNPEFPNWLQGTNVKMSTRPILACTHLGKQRSKMFVLVYHIAIWSVFIYIHDHGLIETLIS